MDNEILKIFAHNIKVERAKKNLSQQELAELTGFSVPYISNIENTKHNISLVSAYKISQIFNKPIDDMLKEDQ